MDAQVEISKIPVSIRLPSRDLAAEQPLEQLEKGDLVRVTLNRLSLFKPAHTDLNPLGEVMSIDRMTLSKESIVKIQLLTETNPTLTTVASMVTKLATQELVKQARGDSSNGYEKYDIVVVKALPRLNEIRKVLIKQGILHCEYAGCLVGVVLHKGLVGNKYNVHFGNFENGCFEVNSSQMALVRSGRIPALGRAAIGNFPFQLEGEKLDLFLSKLSTLDGKVVNRDGDISKIWLDEVKYHQERDPTFSLILDFLNENIFSTSLGKNEAKKKQSIKDMYSVNIESGLLYHIDRSNGNGDLSAKRLCIPIALRELVLHLVHDLNGHFDWKRTFETLRQNYYFPGMLEISRRYVGSCLVCQFCRNKQYFVDKFGDYLYERMQYHSPNRHFVLDMKSVNVVGAGGYVAFIIVKDLFARFIRVVRLRQKDQNYVAKELYEQVFRHLTPGSFTLDMDRGSENVNGICDALQSYYRITVNFTPERSKESQGAVEIFMKTFNDHFKKALVEGVLLKEEWDSWILQLESIYNSLYNPTIGSSPWELVYTTTPPSAANSPFLTGLEIAEASSTGETMVAELRKRNAYLVGVCREKQLKLRHNWEIQKALTHDIHHFQNNDLVLLHLANSNGGVSEKTRCHAGPFKVISRESTTRYRISGGDNKAVSVSGTKLMPYAPSRADLFGQGSIAPSAVGAAQSRLLGYELNKATSEMLLIIETFSALNC